MSKYKIIPYEPKFFDRWNDFVKKSGNGTIFQRLDFLAYHLEKFEGNEHHLICLKGEAIFAVLPLIIDSTTVPGKKMGRSPYGGSFGGPVFAEHTGLKQYTKVVELLMGYFKDLALDELTITLAPHTYNSLGNEYLEFCLLAFGATITKKDLFHVRTLPGAKDHAQISTAFQGRARTTLKKIEKDFVFDSNGSPEAFFRLLKEDKRRHQTAATHTLSELRWLAERFPDEMRIHLATHKATGAMSGILYFRVNSDSVLTFYIAQEDNALGQNGPTFLIHQGMSWANKKGINYFDFGGSTYGYHIDNIGVSEFKESFGAKGYCRSTYHFQFVH
jgi:hypothetical protein